MKLINEQIMTFMNIAVDEKRLPMKLGYTLAANKHILTPFFDAITTKRDELIVQYAIRDEDGNFKTNDNGGVLIGDVVEFTREATELMQLEVDVPIATTSIEVLEKCDTEMFDSLSVAEIASIAFMIED